MVITVFGLGFVGLTTALGFAHLGYKVYGIDVNTERKAILCGGKLPFLEPQMDEVLNSHLNKDFFVCEDVEKAVSESDFVFYCVGTPYGKDGSADLRYLFTAIDTTLAAIHDEKYRVLVIKSTIPPSTTKEKVATYLNSRGTKSELIGLANNPEFLREGHCWEDFILADRIVIGVNDEKSRNLLTKLYSPLNVPICSVSWNTGEFIKYLSNTLLATLISYSNEMSQVADYVGDISVADAFHILHMDKRWKTGTMSTYAYPGCGYGGYCLPKDTNALYAQSVEKGFTPKILGDVIKTNELRPEYIANRISKELSKESVIGILGLAFKPQSDDVRDTPAAKIIMALKEKGYNNIIAFDPVAMGEFIKYYPDLEVKMEKSVISVCEKADVIAVVTAWAEFREELRDVRKNIIDCRYYLK